ncbi:hypothetical protein CJ030_MR8G022174 [Morella rubra]|uniref:Uncharacterized protein n=1 Tax=Morella rubra TaxID=262757 RepID=A0A6A1URH4_9ROSI|nr:hypothetical protein CJ030_MR8G022174 [Morella rubra]
MSLVDRPLTPSRLFFEVQLTQFGAYMQPEWMASEVLRNEPSNEKLFFEVQLTQVGAYMQPEWMASEVLRNEPSDEK